ncbi:META domain-containing protein [Chromatiaceae bacterium AAb-1]|nr:META domain-containing protein [Chromatiaceae bacterium AAb-1]
MKKSVIFTALLLSACAHLQPSQIKQPETVAPADTPVKKEPATVEVKNNDIAQSVATDMEHIFIDSDMTFSGTLPCADCPGIFYHINLYRDGRFEVRQEYLERGQVSLVKGIWLLERRSLHLINQQQTLPAFHFTSNKQLSMLDLEGKPISTTLNYQLNRENEFRKLDTRQTLLGTYQLQNSIASFTSCQTGETLTVANTQHHLPVMRQYQQDPRLNNKAVIATLTGRKNQNNQGEENLYIDKFEQFWPGATCPDMYAPGKLQGIVWRAEKLAEQYIPQQLNVRVIFESDKLYGFAGCNSFNASYKQSSNQLSVQTLTATRKFCSDDSSELEQRFTESLKNADRVEINGDKLQLFKHNQLILQFKPALN